MQEKTLAQKVAEQRAAKAKQAFDFGAAHGAQTETGREYLRQGFFWSRAARAARNGDTAPVTYSPDEGERAQMVASGYTPEAADYELSTRKGAAK